MNKEYKLATIAIHGGYQTEPTTKSVAVPLYQTNAYEFDSTEHAKNLFELKEDGNIYTRLTNPTNAVLEQRIAELDGGVGAVAFSSGHAAIFGTLANLCSAGDEIVASNAIYGGAINMLGVSLDRLGIKVTFVDPDDFDAWESAVSEKTKALFFEIVGNPNANVADIEKIAAVGRKYGIPVIADSTFTTPYLCRPIAFGADIVIHSATKFLGGQFQCDSGIVVTVEILYIKIMCVSSLYNQPDQSYHGMVFADLGKAAFISRLRTLILRDFGACSSPFNSFMVLQGVETLPLRMQKLSENARKVVAIFWSKTAGGFCKLSGIAEQSVL